MFNLIPPGKPTGQQCWNLKISFCTGFVANIDESGGKDCSVWIDIDNHQQYRKYLGKINLTHHGITFEILFNDKIFYSAPAEDIGNQTVCQSIKTDEKFVDCTLTFKISGFQDHHAPLISESTSSRPAIKIKSIEFEGVDVTKLFVNDSIFLFNDSKSIGDTIFGCNGVSTYKFHTPIYSWLLKNSQYIICNKL
jgi:hypothetical protein